MRPIVRRCLLSLSVLAVLASGCSDSESSSPPADIPPVVADNAFVVSASQSDAVAVETDQLVFPAAGNEDLLDRKAGDVIVGRRSTTADSKNPYGFLRKVKTIAKAGDTIVVTTEAASLSEAIVQGKTATVVTQNVSPQGMGGLLGGEVSLSGKVLDSPTFGVKAKVSQGHLKFTPKFDIGMQFGFMSVKEFHAIATGTLDVALALEVSSSMAVSEKFVDLTVFEAPPYVLPPQFIGPIPIEETVRFSVKLTCDLTDKAQFSIEAGASATSTTSIGARYQNKDWSKVATQSFSWQPIGPNLEGKVSGRVRCILKPELALMFYDVAGPFINVGPYVSAGVEVPPCKWDIKAGIEGNFGGKVAILDKTLASASLKLFDQSWELASGSCDAADAGAEGGCSLSVPAPSGWTCEAAKYGDCKCDCGCGVEDYDCQGVTGACSGCTHDVCTSGEPLKPSCNECTAKVCANDSYCCNTQWSGSCVMGAQDLCGLCK